MSSSREPDETGAHPDEPPSAHRRARRYGPPEGEVEVSGSNEQDEADLDLEVWLDLARGALLIEGVEGDAEMALIFVDEVAMTDLNERFMASSGPTDVLAFPIDESGPGGRWPDGGPTGPDRHEPEPDDVPLLLGDVVICPAVAARQASEHECSLEDELALLVVHGVLHVLGHDHAEPQETTVMRSRERALLDALYHRKA